MKLKVTELRYSVDDTNILRGISLSVVRNMFVGLIGPNGSGKTTLLRNVYRVVNPDSGDIILDELDLKKTSGKEVAKRMAVLRQEADTEFDYSVEEIVLMGRFPHHKLLDPDTAEDRDIAKRCLLRVGMFGKKDRMFSTLSGGEKQRVLIARALAQETDFLVLDEPTNHLDIFYKLQILELIKSLDITVISAIHDLDLACKYCDYLYVINEGTVVACGVPHEVITSELLYNVFHVRANVMESENGKIAIDYLGPVTQ